MQAQERVPGTLGSKVNLPRYNGGGEGKQGRGGRRGRSQGPGTCIGLQVLWGHHDYKPDGPLVAEHLIGPPADGAHALHGGDAIVGDEHLDREDEEGARAAHLPALGAACYPRVQVTAAEPPEVPLCISTAHSLAERCSQSAGCMNR